MADWSKPTLSSTYADHHDELRARDEDSARLFSVGTPTNVPTGAIRWNSSTNALQKWDGSAWGSLTSTYAFTAANFSGAVDIQNNLTVLGTLEVATALEAGSFTPDSSSIPAQGMYRPGTNQLGFSTDSALRQSIGSTGIHRWHGTFAAFDMYWQAGTGSLGIGCNPAVGYVLDVDGNAQIGATTGTSALFIGGRIATSTNRSAHIDLVGDNTYSYGLRIERGATGANTTSKIIHRGTGDLEIVANEAAAIAFKTAGGTRLSVASNGNIGCHTTNPTYPFESHGNALIQGVLYTNVLDAAISITTNGTVTWSGGSSTNANTAYGWGNHATAGYLPGTNPRAQGYLYVDSPNDGNSAAVLKLGDGRTSSGYTGIDLVGDSTYTTYGLRIARSDTGANASAYVTNRGTGSLILRTLDNGPLRLRTADSDRIYITATGNIGVGTTSPSHKLDCNGTARFANDTSVDADLQVLGLIQCQTSVSWSGGNSNNANTAYGWGDHSTQGYLTSLGAAGNVTNAKISNWDDAYGWGNHAAAGYANLSGGTTFTGHVYSPERFGHAGDTDTYLRFPAANTCSIVTGGSTRIYFKSDGKVGVNTTSPSHTLDVNGTARFGNDTSVDADLEVLGTVKSNIGFFAYGSPTKGINASGNFVNGTTIGASDSHQRSIKDTRADGDVTPTNFASRIASFSFTDDIANSTRNWDSILTMKGWDGSTYRVWQLMGNASTSGDTDTNLYFREGLGSSWGSLQKIWTSGNDGDGSGLNADKLDGLHSSSFLRSGVANQKVQSYFTITRNSNHGVLEFEDSNGAQRMHVYHYNAGDNGGIGVFDSNGQNRSDLLLYRNGGMTWRGSNVFTGGSTIMPGTDSTYDVGDVMFRFRNLWIKSIYAADLMEMRPTSATASVNQKIGENRSGNGYSYIDLIGDATYNDYGLRLLRGNGGANTWSGLYHRGTGGMYIIANESASIYFRTVNVDRMRIFPSGEVSIGGGSNTESRLKIYRADDGVSDHIQFYNGTTRVGEIGCQDTTWLRINQSTAKNIYTPRYIRADAGFFVNSTGKGINGSGNFIGGTIAGASDYGTLLRSDANDVIGGVLSYHSNDARLQFRNTSYDTYLYIGGWSSSNSSNISRIRTSTGNLHIDSASNGNCYLNWYASNRTIYLGQAGQTVRAAGDNLVWHEGNDGAGSGLDADKLDGYQSSSSNTANTIALRNSAGDTYSRLFRSTYQNQSTIGGAMAYRVSTTDNYIRFCSDKAAIRTFLDVTQSASLIRSDADDNVSAHTEWQDNYQIRLGNGADFRMYWNGSHAYFRNYSHANGNIYFMGENTDGTNQGLLYMNTDLARSYLRLYENGGERLRTKSTGVEVKGNPVTLRVTDTGHTNTYTDFQHDNTALNIIARGGSSYSSINFYQYNGTTNRMAAKFQSGGNFYPGATNTFNMGNGSNRWKRLFAVTATSVSSDRDLKQDIEELNEKEKKVAVALKGLIRKYRLISQVQETGDKAKVHVGVIAQDVGAAFEAEGLDPNDYELYENEMIHEDEDGNECSEEDAVISTRCLGIIYSELLAFIISAM